jgi:hypothetical protein
MSSCPPDLRHVQAAVQNNNHHLSWYMATFWTTTTVPHVGLISLAKFFLFPKFNFALKGY